MSETGNAKLEIRKAVNDVQVAACFDVIAELRPHLIRAEFVEMIRWMTEYDSFNLVFGVYDGRIVCVAGYRLCTTLAYGSVLYVDDLVTTGDLRSHGCGHELLEWLKHEAADQQCDWLQLDSGIQRTDAHRFYEREELVRTSHHFAFRIGRPEPEDG